LKVNNQGNLVILCYQRSQFLARGIYAFGAIVDLKIQLFASETIRLSDLYFQPHTFEVIYSFERNMT